MNNAINLPEKLTTDECMDARGRLCLEHTVEGTENTEKSH